MNITSIKRQHLLWLYKSGSKYAERADLSGANLWEANLSGANLWEANLRETKGIYYQQSSKYLILYQGTHIRCGCMWHTPEEWMSMDYEKVYMVDKEITEEWFSKFQKMLPQWVEFAEHWINL